MSKFSAGHVGVGRELEALAEGLAAERHEDTPWYDLALSDAKLTCEGYVHVQEAEDQALWCFEIGLGGANAMRLLTFLRTLPDEPDEEV